MAEKPILFNSGMVQAIFDGRKTQTRRVIKNAPNAAGCGIFSTSHKHGFGWPHSWALFFEGGAVNSTGLASVKCPYYRQPGDSLWVRETHRECVTCGHALYRATDGDGPCWNCGENPERKWRPSIHMFREDSRITLKVTAVRVERVQDISLADVLKEGVQFIQGSYGFADNEATFGEFAELWDSINAKRGFSWKSNPFVWVVEFSLLARNSA